MSATATRSTQVVAAIRNLLVDYLPDKMDTGGLRAENIYLQGQAATIHAAQCPALCLDDQGSTLLWETMGGSNGDGTVSPGLRCEEYAISLQIWLVGRQGEEMREEFNQWRDGITACLGLHWGEYDGAEQITVESGTPEFPTHISGALLWVGEVSLKASVISRLGEKTILNST